MTYWECKNTFQPNGLPKSHFAVILLNFIFGTKILHAVYEYVYCIVCYDGILFFGHKLLKVINHIYPSAVFFTESANVVQVWLQIEDYSTLCAIFIEHSLLAK